MVSVVVGLAFILIVTVVLWFVNEAEKRKCKHKWTTVTDKALESPYDATVKAGTSLTHMGLEDVEDGEWFFQRKSITILTCDLCGDVHETIV